jgi:hypothetical protein
MYIYKQTEPKLWTVGFYTPDGEWIPEKDFDDPENAADRVAILNGRGKVPADTVEIRTTEALEKIAEAMNRPCWVRMSDDHYINLKQATDIRIIGADGSREMEIFTQNGSRTRTWDPEAIARVLKAMDPVVDGE